MKKLVLGFAIMFATIGAFAQPGNKVQDNKQKHHGKHHDKKAMALQQLNLSDDQKAQIKASNEEFKAKMKAAQGNENQTVKQLRDSRASLAKAHKAKMESILTTEQKGKLAELKTNAKKNHEERSAKHFDKMKKDLSLTDQQVATLKSNQETIKGKFKALHENDKLDRAAKKQQMMALRSEMKSNFDNVLTKEQKDKMQSLRAERKGKMGDRKDKFKHENEVK